MTRHAGITLNFEETRVDVAPRPDEAWEQRCGDGDFELEGSQPASLLLAHGAANCKSRVKLRRKKDDQLHALLVSVYIHRPTSACTHSQHPPAPTASINPYMYMRTSFAAPLHVA